MSARVSLVDPATAPVEVKAFFEKAQAKAGHLDELVQILAHFPGGMMSIARLMTSLGEGRLDRKLRHLAYLKTSRINGCEY